MGTTTGASPLVLCSIAHHEPPNRAQLCPTEPTPGGWGGPKDAAHRGDTGRHGRKTRIEASISARQPLMARQLRGQDIIFSFC